MKWELEWIWKDNKVRCPLHITRWNRHFGFKEFDDILYSSGRKVNPDQGWKAQQLRRIRKQQAKA